MKFIKRIFYTILLSVVVAACVSCAGSRYVAAEFSPMISEMVKFETMSRISLIERGDRGEYSDSISWIARNELDEILYSLRPKLPLASGEIEFFNQLQGEFVGEEIDLLLSSIIDNRANIQHVSLPPMIQSILKAEGKRYGLIMVHDGFTRIKGNYGGQVAKGVGIAVLTGVLSMGAVTYTATPLKYNSTMHAIIVDTERNCVAFYNTVAAEADPCDTAVLSSQVDKLFKKVFW